MIPKIIHYCWFGGNKLPPLAVKCIASWKKYMPDYEIKEWNEINFDVNIIPYTMQAYNAKKYAFVSDFARFYLLYKYGGIYLDTDVELIKSLDNLISNEIVLGFEKPGQVAPGLIIISNKNELFINEMIDMYKLLSFEIKEDLYNYKTIVEYTSEKLIAKGLQNNNNFQTIGNIYIYPTEYFCPININTNRLTITENTYSIHHYASSWLSPWAKLKKHMRKTIGYKIYDFLHAIKNKIMKKDKI